jgi:hypothetical protein
MGIAGLAQGLLLAGNGTTLLCRVRFFWASAGQQQSWYHPTLCKAWVTIASTRRYRFARDYTFLDHHQIWSAANTQATITQ